MRGSPKAAAFPFIFLALAAIFISGCASYRLGPTNGEVAGARSVEVKLFRNDTIEPRLTEAVGIALRRIIQQDGTYTLETRDSGDIVVSGVITRFERTPLSYEAQDVITPRDFAVNLYAQVTVYDRQKSKTIFEGLVSGRTTVRTRNDLFSAERQAAPLAAEDLARNITARVVDGTW